MGFLFSGVFWGIVLILLGASVIINMVFNVHVPLFRIILALVLIWLGLRIMFGGRWDFCRGNAGSRCNTAMFSGKTMFDRSGDGEYGVIFGREVVEAGSIFSSEPGRMHLRVHTVFGNTLLLIPKNMPIMIQATSAFGEVQLPDGSTAAFGSSVYKNDACRSAADASVIRKIDVNVVFGTCRVEEK